MANKKSPSRVDNRKNRKKKKKPNKSLFKRIMLFAALFVGIILVAGAGLFVYYAATAPELTEDDLIGTFSSEVLDQDGKVFYEFGSTHRDFASSNEIPASKHIFA